MSISEIIILAIGVAMDAFAVSIAKGLSVKQVKSRHYLSVALWFGGFQALMPIMGYFLGTWFAHIVERYDHWIAFILLAIIGGKMIKEALTDDARGDDDFSSRTMFVMAVATSIDALAIGISLAFLDVNIWTAVAYIGIITAIFSAVGIKIGHRFGQRHRKSATIFGGVVLIAIAIKILLEHILG
ncbi:MAG: manganese efflux pump [Alistipes sp.]|nr:manganese efflux pump [Alistipes sp.]